MDVFFLYFSFILLVLSFLSLSKNQHWIFRLPEFIKLHLFFLQFIALIGMFVYYPKNLSFWIITVLQVGFIIDHGAILFRFTSFYKKYQTTPFQTETIKIISSNIYQFNTDYQRFINFINKENPDAFITIESNKDWENALRELEKDYSFTEKVTLENTYGMHFYSKIPFEEVTTHFFVADDLPSIEAHFKFRNGEDFVVFAVHPPPPSPTEERTSKERDGDLLSIAKRIKKIDKPVLVVGDFNTVAWSSISSLFRKNSGLIDGRVGRGILASFHAKYWFYRIPLDLVFHSPSISLKNLGVLENIGSDHFPIVCEFGLAQNSMEQKKEVEQLNAEEAHETEEIIQEGKEEESENRNNQT